MSARSKLTYPDIIERIMLGNGGYASLKLIYRKFAEDYSAAKDVRGKTPAASLRHEALSNPRFERIGVGVYALRDRVPSLSFAPEPKTKEEKATRRHSDMQGMLLEIGNARDLVADTYTPDRKKRFQNKTLGNIATMEKMPPFTYRPIVDAVRHVDVAWFNDRGFPVKIFEVEHSPNFRNALTKFCELQDFQSVFCCVAEQKREEKFLRTMGMLAFAAIRERCEFVAYEKVEEEYETALRKRHI